MLPELISHSPDLTQLWHEGYELEIFGNYLLVKNIPYVNSKKEISYGILVTHINQSGGKTLPPDTHVIFFKGEHPCNPDGSEIAGIKNASNITELTEGLSIEHTFSNKPSTGAFANYFDKISSYSEILVQRAQAIDPDVTAKKFALVVSNEADFPFKYADTNSSKAQIEPITSKLRGQSIGIVGLGGTGSYILDLVSKTPVREIHLFDGDNFYQHNAFRAPGAIEGEKFKEHFKKCDYFYAIYGNMHKHIHSHPYYVTEENVAELSNLDFVFLAMDSGAAKRVIVEYLEAKNIPFIDVGMGIEEVDKELIGQVRTTLSTPEKRDHLRRRISFVDAKENLYDQNIQVADLNCLNACLAVIKWKKLCKFYQDLENENNSTYILNTNEILNEDH